jgi:hypothetical protein
LQERSNACLRFWIVRRPWQECTDAPHALGLLRPRRHRPRGRAADERDELASSHGAPASRRIKAPAGRL